MRFSRPQAFDVSRAAARLLALAVAVGAGWALAPAISAEPYLPPARDFEQALPPVERVADAVERARLAAPGGHDHPGEGPVTHRSPAIEASGRFDAAGIAGETRPLELRGRESGGDWGEWIEVANGDPAWFGGADELQLRARGWQPRGTLHYVNVSGDASAEEGLLTEAREAVNGAVVAAAGLFEGDVAEADLRKPKVVSRRAWGAKQRSGGCDPRRRPRTGRVRAMVVHHTVSSNSYSEAEAPGMILAICRFHRNGNGWNDIGYNALVDRFGNIYAGRAGGLRRAVIGAHSEGVNSLTSGVAVLGTHSSTRAGGPIKRALTRWLAWKLVNHGKTAKGRARLVSGGGSTARYPEGRRFRTAKIIGHRRTNLTECPGTRLNRQLHRRVRERVQRRIERKTAEPQRRDRRHGDGGVGR